MKMASYYYSLKGKANAIFKTKSKELFTLSLSLSLLCTELVIHTHGLGNLVVMGSHLQRTSMPKLFARTMVREEGFI